MVDTDRGKCELYKLCAMYLGYFFHQNFRSSGHDEMCNFYIMYYSNADRLEYSGGECGQQNHPEIFKHFPSGSDTPLVHSPESKATSRQAASPVASTVIVHTSHSSVVTPEEQSTRPTVHVQMSSDSTSHDRNHEFDISDLEYGEEESPKSSSKSNQDKQTLAGGNPITSEKVSQGVSTEMVSSSKERQPVVPAATPTSEPVGPVTQAGDSEVHIPELHVVSDWPSLTTIETSKLGQVTGVSLDSKGQVVVFHRGSRIWDEKYVTQLHLLLLLLSNPSYRNWVHVCS